MSTHMAAKRAAARGRNIFGDVINKSKAAKNPEAAVQDPENVGMLPTAMLHKHRVINPEEANRILAEEAAEIEAAEEAEAKAADAADNDGFEPPDSGEKTQDNEE